MTIAEKIQRFMQGKALSLSEFAKLSTIPKSNLSELLNGNRKATISVVQRAADAMGTTVDFLMDDGSGWPPPTPDDRIHLTAAEFRVLGWARDVSGGDPEMEEARRRLLLIGYKPIEGRPAEPMGLPPAGETKKAGPGSNPQPGQKKVQ